MKNGSGFKLAELIHHGEPMQQNHVELAVKVLRDNMKADGELAHAWHCTIAMAFDDAAVSHNATYQAFSNKVGNDAATSLMKMIFDVDTEK